MASEFPDLIMPLQDTEDIMQLAFTGYLVLHMMSISVYKITPIRLLKPEHVRIHMVCPVGIARDSISLVAYYMGGLLYATRLWRLFSDYYFQMKHINWYHLISMLQLDTKTIIFAFDWNLCTWWFLSTLCLVFPGREIVLNMPPAAMVFPAGARHHDVNSQASRCTFCPRLSLASTGRRKSTKVISDPLEKESELSENLTEGERQTNRDNRIHKGWFMETVRERRRGGGVKFMWLSKRR